MQNDILDLEYDDDYYLDQETLNYLQHPVRNHVVNCSFGVLTSIQPLVIRLISFACIRRTLTALLSKGLICRTFFEVILIACGLVLLKLQDDMFQRMVGFIVILSSFLFLRVFILRSLGTCSLIYGIGSLLLWQFLNSEENFMSTRGCIMVMVMKFASAFFDLENGALAGFSSLSFFAYLLDPCTLIFGPWISFFDYEKSLKTGTSKDLFIDGIRGLCVLVLSFVFVFFSSCLTELLYPNFWFWSAFGNAQSFRFSHYFICWLSSGVALLSGCDCGYVSHWWRMEWPRSLVEVVISWDLPMHRFLKKYVFAEVRHKGILVAVFVTYVVSSLLHGINFQLSSVLLTLGFYTFVETRLRDKLSFILDACVRAYECKNCKHRYKKGSLRTLILNFCFCLLAVFHLVYLGMVFDDSAATTGYSMWHTLNLWSSWKYCSHLISFFLFLFSCLI